MPVYKVHRNRGYTTISNYHLKDKNLSLKAKGLMSVILSLPEDWQHNIAGYATMCRDGRRSVSSTFDELKENGYVIVEKRYPQKGDNVIRYVYHIFETPMKGLGAESVDLSGTESRYTKRALQNSAQYNINNTLPRKEDISGEEEFGGSLSSEEDFLVGMGPTVDEVRAYCSANLLDRVDPELFVAYYDARGWVDKGGVRIVNWQAACTTWHIRDRNSAAAKAVGEEGRFDHLGDGWERG